MLSEILRMKRSQMILVPPAPAQRAEVYGPPPCYGPPQTDITFLQKALKATLAQARATVKEYK